MFEPACCSADGAKPVARWQSRRKRRRPEWNWLVTVHLTTTDGGVFSGLTETHDYKAPITFVPTTKAHYSLRGQVNSAPKTDEERIYNIYFQACARREGHDIAKASPHTYTCSYEYGEANRYESGAGTTTFYNGDLLSCA